MPAATQGVKRHRADGPHVAPDGPHASGQRSASHPAVLTDEHVNEILGVLFALSDELDRVSERVWALESACREHGIELPAEVG